MNKNMKNYSINKTINFLINKSRKKKGKFKYPLLDDAFSNADLMKGVKVILSGQLTMSRETKEFENIFGYPLTENYFDSGNCTVYKHASYEEDQCWAKFLLKWFEECICICKM